MREDDLIARLRAIQALYHGATTDGEAQAAAKAWERVNKRLQDERSRRTVEHKFTLQNGFQRRLFMALVRKHGLNPYRYKRQRYTTVQVVATPQFVDEVLWPEFEQLSEVLDRYLDEMTERVIREAVHPDSSDASVQKALEG